MGESYSLHSIKSFAAHGNQFYGKPALGQTGAPALNVNRIRPAKYDNAIVFQTLFMKNL